MFPEIITCKKCGEAKPSTEFYFRNSRLGQNKGHPRIIIESSGCKKCRIIRQSKTYIKKDIDYSSLTTEKRIKRLFINLKQRAKEYGMEFNLDYQFLLQMYQNQGACCAVSGIRFIERREAGTRYSPHQPSLDRIDSKKGYTKDNVQFVLTAINMGKNSWPLDEVIKIWKCVIAKNRKQSSQSTQQIDLINER